MGDELFEAVAPVVGSLGLELVDVEIHPGVVRVTVDRAGGVDLDSVADATRELSSYFDRNDPVPSGRYTLEVSSPGLERPLRTPEQFERALGELVTVRTRPGGTAERRLKGTLESADSDGIVLAGEGMPDGAAHIPYDDIDRARTVFEWGPAPKPGSSTRSKTTQRSDRTKRSSPSGPEKSSTPKKVVAS